MLMPLDVVVAERRDEAAGVVSLTLVRPNGRPLPAWQPGAHVDVLLANGSVRQYSLSSAPEELDRYRIGVLREAAGRGGSEFVHANVHAGTRLQVSEPRNNFALEPTARYVFVAGGIGITPILAMVAAAERNGAAWQLYYGGRSRESMAFVDELSRYGDKVTVVPHDELGLLPIADVVADAPDAQVYACGPAPLLGALEAAMAHRPDDLHLELFVPRGGGGAGDDHAFEVECVESGVTLDIAPGESILSVAEEAGLAVYSSCQEGTCGTCIATIVAGRAEHRDSLLSDADRARQDCLLICVSRAAPDERRLVLDL